MDSLYQKKPRLPYNLDLFFLEHRVLMFYLDEAANDSKANYNPSSVLVFFRSYVILGYI